MATKTPAEPAADEPRNAAIVGYSDYEGAQAPTLRLDGETPRKGSKLQVRLENGVIYSTTVHALIDALDGVNVATTGLEPVPAT